MKIMSYDDDIDDDHDYDDVVMVIVNMMVLRRYSHSDRKDGECK